MLQGRVKPKFWDHHDVAAGPQKHLFNFRRIWKLAVLLTAGVAILPLLFLVVIDYNFTKHALESEIRLRTSRLVSNTRRAVSFFLTERKSALDFIHQDNTFEALNDPARLAAILENLKKGFGGFVDLGVIDPSGIQRSYVGPYQLEDRNYSESEWFKEVVDRGVYISEVFLGFRKVPHLVIAVKHELSNGSFYVLRATLDSERFNDLLSGLEMGGLGDAFIINHEGVLQTPSHSHGEVFEKISLPTPEYAPKTEVLEWAGANGVPLVIGHRYIEDTPFILMVVKQKEELMKPWHRSHKGFIGFFAFSVMIILAVVLSVATYLVDHIYEADQKRVVTLHKVEYSNKMASIGRMAAAVAHEINNPLAIINEKAGLIKDLFSFKDLYAKDHKLMGLVDSILRSVERCAIVTRRLLKFARHTDVSIETINIGELIHDVLGFWSKEAEYRSIAVSVNVPDDIPHFESDRGRLQQIFINLFNNAFAALDNGGFLDITVQRESKDAISFAVSDNGCGISEEDVKHVFEPFFTTKGSRGGTGLGLSITYGLVQEIGGSITVRSEEGKGTSFVIVLPPKVDTKGE